MTHPIQNNFSPQALGHKLTTYSSPQELALILRIGIGAVFVIGGWNKLYQLLSASLQQKIVASYTGTSGYINQFFLDWMFSADSLLSPWGFLTLLSGFELLSGLALIAGLMVRPLALIYAFLMWSFVVSLPVITTPGAEFSGKTYLAPALFVQIRDIALSGLLFTLYNLGAGKYSLDERLFGSLTTSPNTDWENLGLLTRTSLGIIFIIGGLFAGMPNIKTFGIPSVILILLGAGLIAGIRVRILGTITLMLMLYYIATKVSFSKSLISNLNAVKREFAFIAAGAVLMIRGGGSRFTPGDLIQRLSNLRHDHKQNEVQSASS